MFDPEVGNGGNRGEELLRGKFQVLPLEKAADIFLIGHEETSIVAIFKGTTRPMVSV